MKATGIVRQIDDLGRLVIPKELRKTMNLKRKDSIEIFVEKDNIILSKYEKGCLFCGNLEDTFEHEGVTICKSCLKSLYDNKLNEY